jgi:hypothetical protein
VKADRQGLSTEICQIVDARDKHDAELALIDAITEPGKAHVRGLAHPKRHCAIGEPNRALVIAVDTGGRLPFQKREPIQTTNSWRHTLPCSHSSPTRLRNAPLPHSSRYNLRARSMKVGKRETRKVHNTRHIPSVSPPTHQSSA